MIHFSVVMRILVVGAVLTGLKIKALAQSPVDSNPPKDGVVMTKLSRWSIPHWPGQQGSLVTWS
jgi:hypothetical protein